MSGGGVGDVDDAQLIAGLHAATADDHARLRAAVEAVEQARSPLYEWQFGRPTAIIRGERFSDGTIAAALDDGRLLAAARRILDEQGAR